MDTNNIVGNTQKVQLLNVDNNGQASNGQPDENKNNDDNDDADGNNEKKLNEVDNIKVYHEQLKIGNEDNDDDNDDKKDDDSKKNTTFNKADYTIELFYSVLANTHRNKNSSVLIDYEIKESEGKGRGVFAAQLIPKGTPIKRYRTHTSGLHFIELTEKECKEVLSKLSRDDGRLFLSYVCSYKPWIHENTEEVIVFDGDDLMFCNHSRNANMLLNWTTWTYYAGHDIQKGEELAEDYGHYEDPPWLTKLNSEYGLFDLDTLVKTLDSGQFKRQEDNTLKAKDG